MIRCTGLRASDSSHSVGRRCRHFALGRVRRVQTERGSYIEGAMCGRCWRELLATDAGPLAAAADPYAPRWVLRLVVSGGDGELLQAVAARGSGRLPRSIRRRLTAGGVAVSRGRGVVEVARWARVSQHGRVGVQPWAVVLVATTMVGAASVAVLLRSKGSDGSEAAGTTVFMQTSVTGTATTVTGTSSSSPESTVISAATSSDSANHVVSPTLRVTTTSTTTTPPVTTAAPVVKTVSVVLGAGCTRVAYESSKGVTAVVLLEDGAEVASGATSAEWRGAPSSGATWSARLTVAGAWAGAFQWEGC